MLNLKQVADGGIANLIKDSISSDLYKNKAFNQSIDIFCSRAVTVAKAWNKSSRQAGEMIFDPNLVQMQKDSVDFISNIFKSFSNEEKHRFLKKVNYGEGGQKRSRFDLFFSQLGITDKTTMEMIRSKIANPNPNNEALCVELGFRPMPKEQLAGFIDSRIDLNKKMWEQESKTQQTEASSAEEASYSEVQAEIARAIEEAITALPSDADANEKQLAQQTATESVLSEFSMAA